VQIGGYRGYGLQSGSEHGWVDKDGMWHTDVVPMHKDSERR
jgi:hypothetical protein